MKKMKNMIMVVTMAVVICLGSLAFAGEKIVYTVKAGDTLGELMFTWKVQGVDIKQLQKWNPNLGTQIAVGQRIEYYLPDQPVAQKLSAEEVKKIVDETIAAQNRANPQTAKLKPALRFWLIVCFAVVLFFAAVAFMTDYFGIDQPPAIKTSVKAAAAKKITVELEKDGLYETDIEFDPATNRWYTPFHHLAGGKERLWEKSEGDARRTVQKCWRQTEKYGEQIDKLIAEKIIRTKK